MLIRLAVLVALLGHCRREGGLVVVKSGFLGIICIIIHKLTFLTLKWNKNLTYQDNKYSPNLSYLKFNNHKHDYRNHKLRIMKCSTGVSTVKTMKMHFNKNQTKIGYNNDYKIHMNITILMEISSNIHCISKISNIKQKTEIKFNISLSQINCNKDNINYKSK